MANRALWPGYLADPMVLRTSSGYYAYGTGGPDARTREQFDREFPVLCSSDLIRWDEVGGALELPNGGEDLSYWAPEVTEHEGRFLMYYSAGGNEGEGHKIRVAISKNAAGPFVADGEELLPNEPFTIDAHPFKDPKDGGSYLFFAKDFFDEPSGTGIGVVRLSNDMLQAEGEVTPLLRGQSDWQIFERNRSWYRRTWPTWYCVEGPFVVYRQERYWMFYSGGNWHAADYGVGCAVSDSVLGPYTDRRVQEGPTILRTGNDLWGPGHCSIVVGPDGEDRICFHAWDENYTARRLHIAKLTWDQSGPLAQL